MYSVWSILLKLEGGRGHRFMTNLLTAEFKYDWYLQKKIVLVTGAQSWRVEEGKGGGGLSVT